MMTEITPTNAIKFALSYHAVMTMVEKQSTFNIHSPAGHHATPREILKDYVNRCNTIQPMHNEHWLKHAYEVVEIIEAKRHKAWNSLMHNLTKTRETL